MAREDTFDLWRKYRVRPFFRWACRVERADTEDGFRISDHDGSVADAVFLHALRDHMSKPTNVIFSRPMGGKDGGSAVVRDVRYPGDMGHFESAVRQFDLALVGREKGAA